MTKFTLSKVTVSNRWLIALVLFLGLWANDVGAITYQIGTGTATNTQRPIYTCYNYNYSQSIYTAAELNAAGASGSQVISEIRYFYASGGTTTSYWNNWTVYIGNTATSTLASTSSWISTGAMTQVFSGTFTPVAGTWVTITLTTPFTWDGTSNLVVAVDENATNYSCTAAWRTYTSGSGNRYMLYYSDPTNPNPASPPAANVAPGTIMPQIQFEMTGASACTGTPTPGNTLSTAASACSGASFTLSLQNPTTGSGVTYQWQTSFDNSTWANAGGASTGTTFTTTQAAATYYRCEVNCAGNIGTSNSLQVNLTTGVSCLTYCVSIPTNTADEEIYQVTVNGSSTPAAYANLNGCSTPAPGPGSLLSRYSNFLPLGPLTSIQQLQSVSFEIRENECDGASYYNNGIGVWIDYNQNGSFTDANEQIYVEATTSAASAAGDKIISGTFTVPLGALTGQTVMRVIAAEGYAGATLTPCLAYGYGETEDWVIDITATTACSATPTAGTTNSSANPVCSGVNFTLSLTGNTLAAGINYQWQSSPDGITYTNIGGATAATLTTSQTANTYYRCESVCSNGGSSVISSPLNVTMNSFVNCYCTPIHTFGGSGCYYGVVNSVSLNTLSHAPGCAATAPYYLAVPAGTATTTLVPGQSYPLTINSGVYNFVGVWIDFDQSGSFDVSEYQTITPLVNSSGVTWNTTGTVTIPLTALPGLTAMRINTEYYGYSMNSGLGCGPFTYGQTVDYKLTITPLPATPPNPIEVGVPNCATGGTLQAVGSAPSGETWYWQSSASGTSTANPVSGNYTILANGTYYLRSQDNTYLTWSTGAGSITVTDFPAGPADPTVSAPTGNPACGAVTLVSSVAASGSTNYWQGTNATGTSTASIADDGSVNNPYPAPADGIYYVRAQDNTSFCWSNPVATTVTIWPVPTAPILNNPSTICPGSPVALTANAPSAPPAGYTIAAVTHTPITPTGSVTVLVNGGVAVTPQSVASLDDGTWDNLPLPAGFAFNYFGSTPTTFSVSTNGFITFGASGGAFCCSGQTIPAAAAPNNYLALAHEDWLLTTSGTIDYFTEGTAPFRQFIVRYTACPRYGGTGAPTTGQIILNETLNTIDFMATSITTASGDITTMGIEDGTGTTAVIVSGRNATSPWTATNEGWRFTPIQAMGFLWTPNGPGSGIAPGDQLLPNITANPTSTTNYTMTLTDPAHNCQSSSSVLISVAPTPPLPIGTNGSTTCGAGTVTLSATGTGGTLYWYDALIGGTLLGSGNTLPVNVVSADITVYVEESNGTCSGPRESVTAFYTAPPALTVSSDVTFVCSGGSNTGVGGPNNNTVNLSASGSSYTSFTWTSNPSGFSASGANVSDTPSEGTITYTVTASGSGCTAVNSVTITAGAVPSITSVTATPATVCQGGTSQLIAAVAGGIGGGTPPTYCTSLLTSGNYCAAGNGALTNVEIVGTTLNNNSVCNWNATNGTYTSYPAVGNTTTGLVLGQTYTISVSCNTAAIVSMFIDYNQNGQFEPSEWIQVYTAATTGTASFTIPVTATPGTTGMRVRSRLSGNPNGSGDQCLSMGSGSTDDYTITILGGIGFNFAWTGSGLNNYSIFNPVATLGSASTTYNVTVTDPNGCFANGSVTLAEPSSNPGNTLSSANPVCPTQTFTLSTQFTPPGANYSWQSSPDGTTWTDLGSGASTYSTTITTPTYYRANVGCISGSNFTTPILVNVNPFYDCYCGSLAGITADEEIYQVSLNGASTAAAYANAAGCTTAAPGPGSVLSRYSNFKTLGSLTTVFQGASIPWEVRQNECDGTAYYSAGIAIFIDYNQNGSFADPGEAVYQEAGTSAATGLSPGGDKVVSGNITIPLTALSGNTVMRVICAESVAGTAITPCLAYNYGETEDFLINIGDPNCVGIPIFPGNGDQICPDDNLALSWAAKAGATGYDVYLDANNPNPTTLVSANQPGTTYSVGSFVTTNTYYWKVVPLFSVGSCSTPQTFSYSFKPSPQPTANSNAPICEGQSISFFGDNIAPGQSSGNNYSWTGPNGFNDILQNPTLNNATAAAGGTYTVTVTNQFGCSFNATTSVSVTPLPALNILSQTNLTCNGGSDGEFTIEVTNGSGFYLYDENGNINFDGMFLYYSAGTYNIQVTDNNSCASTISVTLTEPDPTTIPDAGLDQTLCANSSVIMAANAATVGTGTWTVIAGSGTFTNPNDPTTTVTGVGAGLNTYAWTIENAACFITNSDNVDVTTNVLPTATVSGTTSICNGQTANLTLDFTGTGPWSYSYSDGSTTFGPFSTSNDPEIVQVNPTTATTYSLVTIDDVNCAGTVSGNASITVIYSPPTGSISTITAPTTACVGTIATVTCNAVPGATSYTWSGPSGTLFNGQPGPYSTATNSVSVEFGILTTTSGYNICATAVNACGQSNTRCIWIRGTVSTPAPITGNTVGCPNTTGPYSTSAVVGASNYFWTASPQMQIIAGQGTQNVTVRFLASFSSGSICVVAATACGSTSTARCMTVSKATTNPGTMSGPFAQCPGQTGQVFSVAPVAGASTYTWTVPANITLTSGQGTPSITVSVGSSFNVGNICVTATSICGIVSAPRCKTISSVQPNTPGNITGPNAGVCGQSITYSVPSQAGVTSYNWVAPAGATIVGGAGTNTVQVTFASNYTTGQLCVTAENGCGSSTARCVNIKGVPADLSVITGPNPVCSFDAGMLYYINPTFGATSYVWTVPAGATIVAGQGTNAIIVDFGIGGGLITVKAVNACGQSGTRTLNVIVNCRMAGSLPNATLNAYPNPVSSELTIDLDAVASGSYAVELLDLSGRVVKSEVMNAIIGLNRNSMDVSTLAKGMYMLNVKNEEGFSQQLRIAVE